MKKLCLLLTALAAVVFAHAAPEVGKPAPDFSLTDTQGNTHSLSSFMGKIVVLEWVNHGCPFVKKHYNQGHMQNLQKAAAADGVVWLSICSSAAGKQGHMSPAEWNETNSAKGASPAAVLLDADGKIGRLYAAKTTPQMFVISADGTLVYAGAIDSVSSPDTSDIAGAKNYVSAALADLKAGRAVEQPQTKPYGCSVKY